MDRFFLRYLSLIVSILATISGVATAQTITGTVRGTITDPSGAVVAGAQIVATNTDTGVSTSTVSDQNGFYNIQFLPIGPYKVTATASGFATSSVGPISLQIDQIAKIDIKLQVGQATTSVSVAAETAPLLQTQDATLGTTISATKLTAIPLSGQNFSAATVFVPGAVAPRYDLMGSSNGTERDTNAATLPSFNGNRQQTNNYVLDGVEINETLNNVVGYNPAPEAIQEMRVITGNAHAEYGNVNGGEVIMVTKGGTNQFHGTLYEYYEDQNLTANLWSNNYSGTPKGVFHQNQFGAAIGGPIKRNKLFFFGDYEAFRNQASGSGVASVATVRMRSGDFSELLAPANGGIQLYNTQNGFNAATPYPNNQIPIVSPVAKFLFAHPEVYPLPNKDAVDGLDLDNYISSTRSVINNNQGDLRMDYSIDSKDSLMGRFSLGDAWDATPKAVLPVFFPTKSDYPFLSFVTNWVHTFSPALVNEFRAGYTRVHWNQGAPSDPSGVFGKNGDEKLGIPFPNQPYPGFSLINLSSNESNLGTAAVGTKFIDNIFVYGDDLIWQHGAHVTKFGVQIVRYQQNSWYPGNDGALGQFAYNGNYTSNQLVKNAGGYGFADFVLDTSSFSGLGGVAGPTGQRQYRNAYYAQDDWKLLPNLTINLGLRYGYDQPIYEVNNKEVNVDVAHPETCPNCLHYAGQNGNSRALYDPFYYEFMPRIGFALQVNPIMVVRGGYGTTDYLEGTGANLRLTQNIPFLPQFENTAEAPSATSAGTPISVESGFGSTAAGTTTYRAWDKHLRPTFVQQFNLTTQFLLTNQTTAQFGYVGEIGQRLIVPVQANQWTTPGDASTAPFLNLVGSSGAIRLTASEGVENYHALQAVLHHSAKNGMEATLNYTWSKAMTNNPGFYGISGVATASAYWQNRYDPHADYGVSGFDNRQSLNGNMVYPLPFGRGQRFGSGWNRLTDEILGGWQISGNAILHTGFPITITSPNHALVNNATARANQYRPLRVVHRTTQHWFGTDPSAKPCTGADNGTCAYGAELSGTFGTAHVNTERAPGYRLMDLSVFKSFQLWESHTLQFRADAFNAFNMASYATPSSSSVTSTSFGRITSTLSPARQFQFSLHYNF